jgi:hypothetical protein
VSGVRHTLKAWPETFVPMWNGMMEYAVRKNDRNWFLESRRESDRRRTDGGSFGSLTWWNHWT